jgi:hypothetical protein
MLVGAALVCGCDEQGQRDVVQAEKNLRETQRDAQEDVAKAQEKAEDDIARAEDKLAEAKRDMAKEDYTYADRVRYRDLIRRDLADAEKEMAELEEASKRASGDAKKRIEKSIADMKVERDQLEVKLDKAEAVSEKEWDEFKTDVNKGVDKLRKEVREAIDSLKKST